VRRPRFKETLQVVYKPLRPEDLAKRVADRRTAQKGAGMRHADAGQWRRETFLLPRTDARERHKRSSRAFRKPPI